MTGASDTTHGVRWDRAAPNPVALLLLAWEKGGTTIVKRDASGDLYGCRDVSAGPHHDSCVTAWIETETARGLAVEDHRAAL